jgi:hypothetical protein
MVFKKATARVKFYILFFERVNFVFIETKVLGCRSREGCGIGSALITIGFWAAGAAKYGSGAIGRGRIQAETN